MNERVYRVLEFEKVKEQLLEYASSSLGQEKVRQLVPSIELEEIIRWQEETDEAATALRLKGNIPLGGIFNIKAHVKRAQIGGMLSPIELMEIASTLKAARQMRRFVDSLLENEVEIPRIFEQVDKMYHLPHVEQPIKNAIDDNGEVLDSASEKLRTIRQQLRTNESRVREKLENMIRSSSAQKMLSDAIVTIRNERFVIPVKQEYRSHYGGIIHDQSSSGQTLFIEPQAIVQLNNQLQELRMNEQQEIDKILLALSSLVGEYTTELLVNVEGLAHLDFIFTKAKYAKKIKATKPTMNDQGIMELRKVRHPFIPIEDVVPNDILLGKDYSTIVITGPNTGGKTVTLKTAGLCTLMAQAGLQIPALDGSVVAVFDAVYADIGDEQSIEQSLSTFSSHMVNIVDILNKVDNRSLVLFDELGAGTDPQEGAALAISILDETYNRGARVIATTHYPELKAYGYNRPGVINASVEFDVETLSPTYRLLLGVPGRSNAFEISKRLGLHSQVINRAKNHVSMESNEVENMIASLENSKREADRELSEAHELLRQAEKLHQDLQKEVIQYYDKKADLFEKAELDASKMVDDAKQEAEKIIRDLRKMRIEKNVEVKEHELIEARKRLDEAAPKITMKKNIQRKTNQHVYRSGDEVKVISFNQKGHLVEKVSNNEWQVQMGILKMKVEEKDLQFISTPKPVETKPLATVRGKDFHVSLELDLRGERYENALLKVEKYLDDALLASYPRVSIIHGKGTGALRQGVQEYLRNHRSVKNIRFGSAPEGGTGVTIVEFK